MALRYTGSMADGADPQAQTRVGSVLNEKWTLEHLIGSGGMGAVYAARHRNGARAAVKILHQELARIPEVRERFLREGYAANRVEHRGVVQVLDDDIVKDGQDEGSAYLVMELLEGESLQDRVVRAPKLGERELLEVMDAVLDVLGAAHQHGVIHRDLKPENIFLAKDPERDGVRVKVLDFGLARISEASTVTSAGMAVGTPSFMSPEQAAGRSEEIDGRTDIFALGATLFRIVTGRRIHDADNMVQLVVLMATVPAPRLRSITPDVSESFAHLIDRALAFDRNDRYPDAAAMQADVRAAIEMATRSPAPSLQVIPFSARNVRIASLSEVASPDALEPQRAKANTNTDLTSVEKEADLSSGDDEQNDEQDDGEESDAGHVPPSRTIAESATLPWLLVLLLLGLGAWKLGPRLQDELERRASLAPIQKLWAPASASVSPDDAPPSPPSPAIEGPPSAVSPAPEPPAPAEVIAEPVAEPTSALRTLEMDEDAGAGALTLVEPIADGAAAAAAASPAVPPPPPAPTPAPTPAPIVQRDAGAPHAVAAVPRPRPPSPPQAKKPPAKKPPAKKPPPPPPPQRRR